VPEGKASIPISSRSEHHTDKIMRIAGRLESLIERGIMRFCKGHSDQDLLIEQLLAPRQQ